MAAGTATIKNCKCKHEYQDRKYGKGRRVKNETGNAQYRCTVCEKTGDS